MKEKRRNSEKRRNLQRAREGERIATRRCGCKTRKRGRKLGIIERKWRRTGHELRGDEK